MEKNAQRIYCLNKNAEVAGLVQGMSLADSRAICPDLVSEPASFQADLKFLQVLGRWAERYSPLVSLDGRDGLLLNILGAEHLFGGEEALLGDLLARLDRAGFSARIGLADTRGAAWALAHFGAGQEIAPVGQSFDAIKRFHVQALGLDEKVCAALKRLGIITISQLAKVERISLSRRFGRDILHRFDMAVGRQGELFVPQKRQKNFTARLTLPEPIGLEKDLLAALKRLLSRVCIRLESAHMGARRLRLVARRVDKKDEISEIGLARPMRDKKRMLLLFERSIGAMDAGFGIDRLHLEALEVEPLTLKQLTYEQTQEKNELSDLISRIGNRVGFENVQRYHLAQSHIPEKSFVICPAAYSEPVIDWPKGFRRPLSIFQPENISAHGQKPPKNFYWRRMKFGIAKSKGPERILAEWWLDDPDWRSGMRDYWWVQTYQGRRLWLFYTPQNPGWFVQGEFA